MTTDKENIPSEPKAVQSPGALTLSAESGSISASWLYGAVDLQNDTLLVWSSAGEEVGRHQEPSGRVRYTINGLVADTLYAVDAYGVRGGETSVVPMRKSITTKPLAGRPEPPANLVAYPQLELMDLKWTPTNNTASYKLQFGRVPSEDVYRTETSTAPSHTFDRLGSDTLYWFKVFAVNAAGESDATRITAKTLEYTGPVDPAPPETPKNLLATPAIDTMEVKWSAAERATGYVINYRAEPGGPTLTINTRLLTETLKNLASGTLYVIEVIAENAQGPSLPAQISERTLVQHPAKPSPYTAHVRFSQVTLSWGGSSPEYEVSWGLMSKYPDHIALYLTDKKEQIFQDLLPLTAYYFHVRAKNGGAYSESASTSADIGPDKTQPRNVRHPGRTYSSAWLKWDEPEDNAFLLGYDVTSPGITTVQTTAPEAIVTGLTPGVAHVFTIQPRRPPERRPALSASLSVTTHDRVPPTLPTTLKLRALTSDSAELSWSASQDNVGVTGHEVRLNDGAWVAASGTRHIFNGLIDGQTDVFEVRAKDAANNTSMAASLKHQVDRINPTTPGIPVASDISSSSARLTWTASSDNVGVKDYQIVINDTPVVIVAVPYYDCTGLKEAASYAVDVIARDAAGNLSAPASASFKTLLNPPQNLTFSHLGGIGKLKWDKVADEAVTFKASVNGVDIRIDQTNDSANFRLRDLPAGPVYRIKVRAEKGADYCADTSLDVTVDDTVRPGNPGIPVASDVTETSALMTWTPSTSSQPLQGYRVSINGWPLGLVAGTSFPLKLLVGGVLYLFSVRAQDTVGNLSDGMVGGFKTLGDPPLPPPGIPENLRITSRTPESISLTWTEGEGAGVAMHYQITCDDESLSTRTFFTEGTIRGLSPGLSYTVQVRGCDLFQQVSEPAEILCPTST